VALSVGIGLVAGVVGYWAGPVLSALALGACGAAMSLAGFLAAPFARLCKGTQPPGSDSVPPR
jgi:hypothetical protein